MTLKIRLFILITLMYVNTTLAQTTAIPDQNFEQALIDMNIDSDGVVNGQVLTSDIENIVELDLSNLYDSLMYFGGTITDFTGIEDFTALEILNISNIDIYLSEDQADVFNSNLNLKEFRADDSCADCGPGTYIPYLDFSDLDDLEYISLVTSGQIYSINLDNPNSFYENLTIDLSHEYWSPPATYTVCINVSDAQAASSNQYPYNTWDVIAPAPDVNGYVWRDYEFSSSCNLSTSDFDRLTKIKVYPNPVKDELRFENPDSINIDKVEVYDISGQKLKTFSSVDEHIDLESLGSGVYFVMIHHQGNSSTFRVLKK